MVCFISHMSMAPMAISQRLPLWYTLKGIVQIFWLIVWSTHTTRGGEGGSPWCCNKTLLFFLVDTRGNPYNPRISNTLTTQKRTREHQYHYLHLLQSPRDSALDSYHCFSPALVNDASGCSPGSASKFMQCLHLLASSHKDSTRLLQINTSTDQV
jgi:hypothetical protein